MSESNMERFERLAMEFQCETGLMAPGKSESAAGDSRYTLEERQAAWKEWLKERIMVFERLAVNFPEETVVKVDKLRLKLLEEHGMSVRSGTLIAALVAEGLARFEVFELAELLKEAQRC